jgi:hypothetical protein
MVSQSGAKAQSIPLATFGLESSIAPAPCVSGNSKFPPHFCRVQRPKPRPLPRRSKSLPLRQTAGKREPAPTPVGQGKNAAPFCPPRGLLVADEVQRSTRVGGVFASLVCEPGAPGPCAQDSCTMCPGHLHRLPGGFAPFARRLCTICPVVFHQSRVDFSKKPRWLFIKAALALHKSPVDLGSKTPGMPARFFAAFRIGLPFYCTLVLCPSLWLDWEGMLPHIQARCDCPRPSLLPGSAIGRILRSSVEGWHV